jgi:hypothetical protein
MVGERSASSPLDDSRRLRPQHRPARAIAAQR